jgi:hypothetical protein
MKTCRSQLPPVFDLADFNVGALAGLPLLDPPKVAK